MGNHTLEQPATNVAADRPTTTDHREYHLHTRPGDLARHCLLVGSPERAAMIAAEIFDDAREVAAYRGSVSFTGRYAGQPISVVGHGMGSASLAIFLPEIVRSGAGVLIRVGSCGALQPKVALGSAAICTAAVRLDGAGENWAPLAWPAVADYRVTAALVRAAKRLGLPYHAGIGVTTTCFNEGQARPDLNGYLPPRLQAQHEELVARGALFYSMEEATLFVWCGTHGAIPCGAVDAVYANRVDNSFAPSGEREAAVIACEACRTDLSGL
jgi:uridine phosphorylase